MLPLTELAGRLPCRAEGWSLFRDDGDEALDKREDVVASLSTEVRDDTLPGDLDARDEESVGGWCEPEDDEAGGMVDGGTPNIDANKGLLRLAARPETNNVVHND